MYVFFWKRVLDLCLVAVALPIVLVSMAIVAVLVRISMGPPILFRHARPGRHAAMFTVYKFRTMTDARDASGALLPDPDRVTRIGRLLRRTSLDELPQLYNVLRGEMSIVGPRPLLDRYLPLYTNEQARRHEIRPGITGLAQVNGRNSMTWDEKFACDVYYVDHASLLLDVRILLRTVVKVLRRDDVSADGDVTVPPFTGSAMSRQGGEA